MHLFYIMTPGINAINAIILVALLYIFVKNYRNIKSNYNFGLLLFSSLFLAQNLLMLHLGIFMWPSGITEDIMLHILVVNVIQLLGLIPLLYITWK
ncbi:MAG: hypothetical protein JXC85_02125 [Candidatus Aenigmarchaeota archaeon]|nr:hypothetical protein [Candidatus Aenigmarchaeota archaeon]